MSFGEEIRASTAAHRDLGSGYDAAVAEGLVERIGEEIDRRVDARLFGQLQAPPPRRSGPAPGRIGVAPVFLALGSMAMASRTPLGSNANPPTVEGASNPRSSPVALRTTACLPADQATLWRGPVAT